MSGNTEASALSAGILGFSQGDLFARAMLMDLQAMDKHKGSVGYDVIAYCRLLRPVLEDDERHISAELREILLYWILNRFVHFGGYDVFNHTQIAPTVFELSGGDMKKTVDLIKQFELEKQRENA